jgi:hypothetical protein
MKEIIVYSKDGERDVYRSENSITVLNGFVVLVDAYGADDPDKLKYEKYINLDQVREVEVFNLNKE